MSKPCLLWAGSVNPRTGYGQRTVKRKLWTAHRYAAHCAHGPCPPGLFTLHSCDVRLCIEPEHLRYGTPQENSDDMVARGRHSKVQRAIRDEEVVAIRLAHAGGESQRSISRRTGYPQGSISEVVRRLTYKEIP